MDVLFETNSGETFEMEFGYWDTVLEIKQKIEKYQRIPVFKQTLFFRGKALQDHLDIEQCQILHNSRIQIFVDPNPNPNHNNNQVLQPLRITPPSNPTEQIINSHQDLTLRPRIKMNLTVRGEQRTMTVGNQYEVLQAEQSFVNIQDSSLKVGSNKKVPQQRMSVFVKPYYGEDKVRKNLIVVDVNTTDQVKILRNELIRRQQMGHINRPQEGNYFLVCKGRVLNEDQSFEWNGVAHTDTVEIIPNLLNSLVFGFGKGL